MAARRRAARARAARPACRRPRRAGRACRVRPPGRCPPAGPIARRSAARCALLAHPSTAPFPRRQAVAARCEALCPTIRSMYRPLWLPGSPDPAVRPGSAVPLSQPVPRPRKAGRPRVGRDPLPDGPGWSPGAEIVSLLTINAGARPRARGRAPARPRRVARRRSRSCIRPSCSAATSGAPTCRSRSPWRWRRSRAPSARPCTPRTARGCGSRSSREAPSLGYLFERKEHLAFGAIFLAWVGALSYVAALRYADVGGRDALRKAAHWSFVASALLGVVDGAPRDDRCVIPHVLIRAGTRHRRRREAGKSSANDATRRTPGRSRDLDDPRQRQDGPAGGRHSGAVRNLCVTRIK